jgi:hypothetical protein
MGDFGRTKRPDGANPQRAPADQDSSATDLRAAQLARLVQRRMREGGGRAQQEGFVRATTGPGQEVPYRAEMERAFGHDLSGVRAHVGQGAALDGMGAQAAAQGEKVAFASATPDREVVAHELTHVVQQRQSGGPAPVARSATASHVDDASEVEARSAARSVASGGSATVSAAPSAALHFDWRKDLKSLVSDEMGAVLIESALDGIPEAFLEEQLTQILGVVLKTTDPSDVTIGTKVRAEADKRLSQRGGGQSSSNTNAPPSSNTNAPPSSSSSEQPSSSNNSSQQPEPSSTSSPPSSGPGEGQKGGPKPPLRQVGPGNNYWILSDSDPNPLVVKDAQNDQRFYVVGRDESPMDYGYEHGYVEIEQCCGALAVYWAQNPSSEMSFASLSAAGQAEVITATIESGNKGIQAQESVAKRKLGLESFRPEDKVDSSKWNKPGKKFILFSFDHTLAAIVRSGNRVEVYDPNQSGTEFSTWENFLGELQVMYQSYLA